MTLEEAIEHAKEVARTCDDGVCASEHAQLAEWLSLLKVYTDTHMADEVRRARHEMHGWQSEWKREMERRKELESENAKLRELLKNALTYIEHEGCGVECPETGSSATLTPCDACNRYETESCAYVIAQSACELGIEVTDA